MLRGVYKESPLVVVLVVAIVLIIILVLSLFSACVQRFVGARGTVVVDLTLVWLFACLVARVLMFPGSLKLFQRNTEATFRTEMARQYTHYLRQLWFFLDNAAQQSRGMLRGVTADGIVKGCAVIDTLSASFQMQQQQHEVRLSREQETMLIAAQDVERWLGGAKVRKSGGPFRTPQEAGTAGLVPLTDWLRQNAAGMVPLGVPPLHALAGVDLVCEREELLSSIEKIRQLLDILDELRHQKKSLFSNAVRFFQVPTIGSLNQLRTELQMRYSGSQCWVPTRGGRRLDAMFIPADGGPGTTEDEVGREDAPLKNTKPSNFSGPTLIWCNPNAAYYETMVYQGSWLNFWLARGCNLFLFNYAGYGRSTGRPSPSRITEDGEAVIRFLKSKGITQIGVYGRSIGGVAACHLARRHADVVHFLVADRTMSTLEGAAKYMYGTWAAKGLKLTAMMADNVDNFWEVRCYKLLVCDPKDTMILDLAALRTAIALRVVERMAPEERLAIDEEKLKSLAEVWRFFGLLFAICESDEESGFEIALGHHDARPARQPNFIRDDLRTDFRLKVGENGSQVPSASPGASAASVGDRLVSTQWLEDNPGIVRSTMAGCIDQVRSALDVVGEHLEGGGVTLNDVFIDNPNNASYALRCMLANLQVWGSLGDQREEGGELATGEQQAGHSFAVDHQLYGAAVAEHEIEHFLRKDGDDSDYLPPREASPRRLEELSQVLAPEMLSTYHRRLARARVAQVRREFRRRLTAMQHAIGQLGSSSSGAVADVQAGEQADPRLLRSVLHHLCEVESFVSALSRFFKSVDLALPYSRQKGPMASSSDGFQDPPLSDSSDEKQLESCTERLEGASVKHSAAIPQPAIDHAAAGYMMHIDCGHNGVLDEVDLRQLSLHLRAARFGRAPTETL